ncbi:MAG TPA: hypothetical protein DCS93_16085 [Microscillaceae bacterium]|nr:hypothetical protein [Microscillaceae bacterium]
MKKDRTQELIKQSGLTTSDDFTDLLMNRIAQEKPIRFLVWHLVALIGGLTTILVFVFILGSHLSFQIPGLATQVNLPPNTPQIFLIVFITLTINRLIVLKKEIA